MINKKYIVYMILPALIAGCGKKLLQKDPQAAVVQENFYKTDQHFELAIAAAYDPLGWETDRPGSVYANPFFFGDIVSDDAYKGGQNEGDQGNWHAIETFTANPSLREFLLPWQKFYTGIYRCNLVIENAEKAESVSASTKNKVIGEAKFLRALYHFELVKHYGDVPLITKLFSPDDFSTTRTAKSVVFAQIEADFKEASSLLPDVGGGRATNGAAIALLARAQMYQTFQNPNKWAEVLDNANKVISSGKYQLEPKFEDVFTQATENGKESIFEIQHAVSMPGQGGDNGSQWTRGNEGTVMNTMTRGRQNGGWGFNVPTESLIGIYSVPADKMRRRATFFLNGDTIIWKGVQDPEIYVLTSDEYPFTGAATRKYIEAPDAAQLNVSDGPSNPRIIRYADVLLMAAEAANELGRGSAEVNKYLNPVRLRAGLPENNINSKDSLRTAIWDERRKELALEGHRFFDLVRQGRAAEVMQASPEGKRFRKGINEVFPIPQTEIDVSKGKLEQNPGY